jgi:DNA-binding XRE family transcriptional regulator
MGISHRIKLIMNGLGYNKNSFSTAIGMTNNVTIGRIVNENRNPSFDIIEKIIQTFGSKINSDWLITGKGEPFKDSEASSKTYQIKKSDVLEYLREKDIKIEKLIEENVRLKQEVSTLKKH